MKKTALVLVSLLLVCLLFAGCTQESPDYTMKGTVNEIGNHIDFTVTENSYVSGVFWALTDESTVYLFDDGSKATREDISSGSEITVYYSGQIMMSYPGQVYASKIVIEK